VTNTDSARSNLSEPIQRNNHANSEIQSQFYGSLGAKLGVNYAINNAGNSAHKGVSTLDTAHSDVFSSSNEPQRNVNVPMSSFVRGKMMDLSIAREREGERETKKDEIDPTRIWRSEDIIVALSARWLAFDHPTGCSHSRGHSRDNTNNSNSSSNNNNKNNLRRLSTIGNPNLQLKLLSG